MRHFAAHTGGRYVLRFPNKPLPKWVALSVGNVYRVGDQFMLAVSFDGSLDATGYISATGIPREDPKKWKPTDSFYRSARFLKPAASLSEVAAAPAADLMWQDKAHNLVWLKVQGGLFPNDPKDLSAVPPTDLRNYGVMIYAKTAS